MDVTANHRPPPSPACSRVSRSPSPPPRTDCSGSSSRPGSATSPASTRTPTGAIRRTRGAPGPRRLGMVGAGRARRDRLRPRRRLRDRLRRPQAPTRAPRWRWRDGGGRHRPVALPERGLGELWLSGRSRPRASTPPPARPGRGSGRGASRPARSASGLAGTGGPLRRRLGAEDLFLGLAGEQRLELLLLDRLALDEHLGDRAQRARGARSSRSLARWCAASTMRRISSSISRAISSE